MIMCVVRKILTTKHNNQMNREATLEQLRQLKLQGMARGYEAVLSLPVKTASPGHMSL
jgi:hypothetical protein